MGRIGRLLASARKAEERMRIDPLSDRILVRLVEAESITKGGLVVPDAAKRRPQEAIVVAVGPGAPAATFCSVCTRVLDITGHLPLARPLPVKVGDRVLVSQFAGVEIKKDNVDHLIINENDLLGVIT